MPVTYQGGAPLTGSPGGITPFPAPIDSGLSASVFGERWFVDGNRGADGNTGRDRNQPLRTMAEAFTRISSGAVIEFRGNITEQVTTPVGIFDVTIIGCGNRPRHADAHTGYNGYSAATWKSPSSPTAATPLLKVLQQGWRFFNILFSCPTDAAGVQLFRDGGAGDAERDASHAHFLNCRIDGGQDGIQIIETAFVRVEGCLFRGQTGVAIKSTAGSGVATPLLAQITNNLFMNNANHIVMASNQGFIYRNVFGKFTTMAIDLSAAGGDNIITDNYLSGTYSIVGGYKKAAASDEWAGNFNTLAGGITTADPA